MNLEHRNFEDIDMNEEYEMVPFEPMLYSYGQMNSMPSMGMPMNDINSMDMMYGDAPIKDYQGENEGLRQKDVYEDREPFKDGYNNPNKFNPKYNDVDYIVRRIERYNPGIFRKLTRCGIPYPEARDIVRRIVKLTLMYSEE